MSKKETRNVLITSGEGQTGHLIAELILSDEQFTKHVSQVTVSTMNPDHPHIKGLEELGAKIVAMERDDVEGLTKSMKECGADTVMLIPPSVDDKVEVTKQMIEAAKAAGIANCVLLSSAGCDMADPQKQPRLREFITLETMMMETKGDTETPLGHSPCIIRAGFYAENMLLYNKQAQQEGKLPLPIGKNHKFAPVALGDVALMAAWILAGEAPGQHGLSDRHRGQLCVLTGPMLASGEELATAAAQGLSAKMEFEDIPEEEAKKILDAQAEISNAEKEYVLEYYSLVREGKTNYISTHAFHDITGNHPQEPVDFFKTYNAEFQPKKRRKTKA